MLWKQDFQIRTRGDLIWHDLCMYNLGSTTVLEIKVTFKTDHIMQAATPFYYFQRPS